MAPKTAQNKLVGGTDANRSRERMRKEVAYLRATVAELEGELAQLRSQQNELVVATATSDLSMYTQALANTAWQDIAERQRRRRYAAEVENSKLRECVEDQIRLGKTLEKLLHKRQHSEVESMLSRRPTLLKVAGNGGRSPLDDLAMENELRSSLHELIEQHQTVYQNECFQEEGPFRVIESRFEEGRGTFVEAAERRLLPFPADTLSDATLLQFQSHDPCASRDRPGDLIMCDIGMMVETARFRGISRSKLLIQRVVLAEEIVIVFAGLTDPSDALGVASDGLYVRHSGWNRLRELPKPLDDPSAPTITENSMYHIARPEIFYHVAQDQKRKIGTLTNFVLSTLGFQMDMSRESVDNWLLANTNTNTHSEAPYASRFWRWSERPLPVARG